MFDFKNASQKLHYAFFTVLQLRVYVYINILIKSTSSTTSNTAHFNFVSLPTITTILFHKLKTNPNIRKFTQAKTSAIKLCS